MKRRQPGIASIAALAVILDLGPWPFHAPKNEVTWLEDRNASASATTAPP